MQQCYHNDMMYYQFPLLISHSLEHGIFTRKGGVSTGVYDSLNVGSTVGDDFDHVLENRSRMASAMRVSEEAARTTWQVHGAAVLVVDANTPQDWPPRKADGIITRSTDVPLVMRFADCVPVVLYDPVCRAIGLAHAGWKGTVLGAGAATARAMIEAFGSRPQDIVAGIGPSIGPCCYEVGSEVVDAVRETFSASSDLIIPAQNGNGAHFDLWRANEHALAQAGVEHIEIARICTSCNTHEFYSHRREQGKTGRFGAMVVIRGTG